MAQSINLANLSAYVDQLNWDIVREATLKGGLMKRIPHMSNIPAGTTRVINGITSLPKMVAGGCVDITTGWTGSVTPFQQSLATVKVMVPEKICSSDIDSTFYGMGAHSIAGDGGDINTAFLDVYIADKADKIPYLVECELVAGSTTATFSTATTGLVNGILYDMFVTNSGNITSAGVTNSYNATTAKSIIDQVVNKLVTSKPELVRANDLELWLSYADFNTYFNALRDANLFHWNPYDNNGNPVYEMPYFGLTKVKMVAVDGFNCLTNGQKYFILSQASNWRYGYDKDEMASANQLYYRWEDKSLYYRWEAAIGIKAAYYGNIIYGKTT